MSTADVDRYYERMLEPDELRKRGQTVQALASALELSALIPSVIKETETIHGGFDLSSIPPIETGSLLAAILGDAGALDKIELLVTAHEDSCPGGDMVDRARKDMALLAAIKDHLAANPGAMQSELGHSQLRRASGVEIGGLHEPGRSSPTRDAGSKLHALFLTQ